MHRATVPVLILVCVVIAAALAWMTLNRSETEEAGVQQARRVAPFHRLEVGGLVRVTLVQGDAEAVDVQVPADAGAVDVTVRDGTLVISGHDHPQFLGWIFGARHRDRAARVAIRFRTLEAIALSGAVRLEAPALHTDSLAIDASGGSSLRIADLQATALRVSGSGALDARIAGRVDNEEVSISGAGSYRADELHADHASVDVSGIGNVVVYAGDTLRATISGAGNIEYLGDPQVTEDVSGIGRVRRREHRSSIEDAPNPAEPSAPSALSGPPEDQCNADGASAASLNSSRSPVAGSMSGCTPGWQRMSVTRQSASNATSIAATSRTGSYG
jgi:hypothetical protein